jgi:hypothetical protein
MESETIAYILEIENILGITIPTYKKDAIDLFVYSEKIADRWNSHKRIWLPVWGNETANKICLKTGVSRGSYPNGSTHAYGYTQGNGMTQYFDTGIRASDIINSDNSHVFAVLDGSPSNAIHGIGANYPFSTNSSGGAYGWCSLLRYTNSTIGGVFDIIINPATHYISNLRNISEVPTYSVLLNRTNNCTPLSGELYDKGYVDNTLTGWVKYPEIPVSTDHGLVDNTLTGWVKYPEIPVSTDQGYVDNTLTGWVKYPDLTPPPEEGTYIYNIELSIT